MTTLVWFRRDLRLRDNPALQSALEAAGPVVPVYIHDSEQSYAWKPGAASNWYLQQSLQALHKELATHGLHLMILKGQPASILQQLSRRMKALRVLWNRVYEPEWELCDRQVEKALREVGVETENYHDHSLLIPGTVRNQSGTPYKVFTPFWKSIEASLIHSRPGFLGRHLSESPGQGQLPPTHIPAGSPDEVVLFDRLRWHQHLQQYWTAGESAALKQLSLALNRLDQYAEQRDLPGTQGTSGLSASLHFGEISPWRVVDDLRPAWTGEWGNAAAIGAAALIRQIGWREFAIHLLHAHPHSPDESIRPEFGAGDLWFEDPVSLEAWQTGKTGIALVDAGMHQLWETGWMHNRVRMITASFLTKHLGQHWLHGARWFWDTLVDADLANNSMGWQWVAGCGCDAAPYYRIFNPERQAQRFDADGKYLKRWLGNRRSSCTTIVDLPAARDSALTRYKKLKERRTLVSLKN